MNEAEQAILRVVEAYKAAVFAKDVDAFVALYDQEVCVFDLWGTWSYHGVAAWRGMVTEWFGSLGTERVVVAMEGVHTIVAHDAAVVHAFVSYTGVSAEGNAVRTMQNRLTWALTQHAGGWTIVHEHSSAPVDPATSTVILHR